MRIILIFFIIRKSQNSHLNPRTFPKKILSVAGTMCGVERNELHELQAITRSSETRAQNQGFRRLPASSREVGAGRRRSHASGDIGSMTMAAVAPEKDTQLHLRRRTDRIFHPQKRRKYVLNAATKST